MGKYKVLREIKKMTTSHSIPKRPIDRRFSEKLDKSSPSPSEGLLGTYQLLTKYFSTFITDSPGDDFATQDLH